MLQFIGFALSLLAVVYTFLTLWSLRKNIAAAKVSGIHYVVVPIYYFSLPWLVGSQFFLPYLEKLPKRWTYPWLGLLKPEHSWEQSYSTFVERGTDTFLTVAPGGILMWTADADVIAEMVGTRRNDFPKPSHFYRSVNIYGKNVVSSEGALWRQHRRITSPPFTEKNNHLVWAESIACAQSMLKSWVGESGKEVRTVDTIADDFMRLSLNVISAAGFGVKLGWPGQKASEKTEQGLIVASDDSVPNGHTMTFVNSLQNLLHGVVWLIILPRFLLRILPIKSAKIAKESYIEWGKYMREMLEAKKSELSSGAETDEGMDLMGALIRGAGAGRVSRTGEKTEPAPQQQLTDDEILGNAFVFILAGHETVAASSFHSIIYLAMQTACQRRLQKELDDIFQDRPISEWDYDRDLPKLFNGYAGAIMAEELRILPPVINIPKFTHTPQPLMVDGKKCLVPARTLINLTTASVHRNPKFWPAGLPTDPKDPVHPTSNLDNDLEEFKPERWFIHNDGKDVHANGHMPSAAATKDVGTDDLHMNTASDTGATMYKPYKGSYIPFSDGYRSCLGRRFAQVEALVILAVIFSQYSIELAVDQWASDEEVEKMSMEERRVVWEKARARTMDLLRNGMMSMITIQIRKGKIPFRIVKRGRERFHFP